MKSANLGFTAHLEVFWKNVTHIKNIEWMNENNPSTLR